MLNLYNLPDELILKILSNLSPKDLAGFAVTKKLYAFACIALFEKNDEEALKFQNGIIKQWLQHFEFYEKLIFPKENLNGREQWEERLRRIWTIHDPSFEDLILRAELLRKLRDINDDLDPAITRYLMNPKNANDPAFLSGMNMFAHKITGQQIDECIFSITSEQTRLFSGFPAFFTRNNNQAHRDDEQRLATKTLISQAHRLDETKTKVLIKALCQLLKDGRQHSTDKAYIELLSALSSQCPQDCVAQTFEILNTFYRTSKMDDHSQRENTLKGICRLVHQCSTQQVMGFLETISKRHERGNDISYFDVSHVQHVFETYSSKCPPNEIATYLEKLISMTTHEFRSIKTAAFASIDVLLPRLKPEALSRIIEQMMDRAKNGERFVQYNALISLSNGLPLCSAKERNKALGEILPMLKVPGIIAARATRYFSKLLSQAQINDLMSTLYPLLPLNVGNDESPAVIGLSALASRCPTTEISKYIESLEPFLDEFSARCIDACGALLVIATRCNQDQLSQIITLTTPLIEDPSVATPEIAKKILDLALLRSGNTEKERFFSIMIERLKINDIRVHADGICSALTQVSAHCPPALVVDLVKALSTKLMDDDKDVRNEARKCLVAYARLSKSISLQMPGCFSAHCGWEALALLEFACFIVKGNLVINAEFDNSVSTIKIVAHLGDESITDLLINEIAKNGRPEKLGSQLTLALLLPHLKNERIEALRRLHVTSSIELLSVALIARAHQPIEHNSGNKLSQNQTL